MWVYGNLYIIAGIATGVAFAQVSIVTFSSIFLRITVLIQFLAFCNISRKNTWGSDSTSEILMESSLINQRHTFGENCKPGVIFTIPPHPRYVLKPNQKSEKILVSFFEWFSVPWKSCFRCVCDIHLHTFNILPSLATQQSRSGIFTV